jgi:prepilin-type N-terminal cleavage/methylation domain-containing protein
MVELNRQSKLNDSGFTLIEVMVAMLVFGVVMSTMPSVFVAHLRYNQRAEIKTASMHAAQRVLDSYRVVDPSSLPSSGSVTEANIVIGSYTFSPTTSFCSQASYCITNNNRHIKVDIAYDGENTYTVETVFTKLR